MGLSIAAPFERGIYEYPASAAEVSDRIRQQNFSKIQSTQNELEKIKYLIISGNLDYAKVLLKEATLSQDFSKAIQLRYLAMIYFIEGKYKLALNTLKNNELKKLQAQPKVCLIKILSLIILNKKEEVASEWAECEEATISYSPNSLIWMRILVGLKISKDPNYIQKLFDNISVDNIEKNRLRIYLKLALYLNQQERVIPRFKFFNEEVLQDNVLRELIGFNYFRSGDITKAYSLIENLETANSEIFKGNIYSFQGQDSLAYAQYKLALQRKNNSLNAIDRLIPLAWKLNQWGEGLQFLQKNPLTDKNSVSYYTVMAAFLTMNNKHISAERTLNQVLELTNKGQPVEVSQLYSYNALQINKFEDSELYSSISCESNDGLNCWFSLMSAEWQELMAHSGENIAHHKNIPDLITLNSTQRESAPLEEINGLSQLKVEELDNNLIELVPDKKK